MSLDDPEVVRAEYADERGLEGRRSIEVGPGPGEVSARIARELAAEVVAIDASERMVELAREKGVDARLGDVQDLAFDDGSFDLVVAAWMLYHVPDVDRGLSEIARVLEPGGRLIAVTNSGRHLSEVRELAGVSWSGGIPFSRENGTEVLGRYFDDVRGTDADQWVTFPDTAAVCRYLESTILLKDGIDRVPALDGPVRAGARTTVFVARKAA